MMATDGAVAQPPPLLPARHDGRQVPIVVEPDSASALDVETASVLTASRYGSAQEEEEEEEDVIRSRTPTIPANIPDHPIPSMQEAFAESLVEVTNGGLAHKPKLGAGGDAKSRRERLLDEDKSAGPPAALWRFRPGQKCHELRKLMAQISFGVYLLLRGLANNNAQVIQILQGHIDEVDEFLETTMEDFAVALTDLNERIEYLKVPMENMDVFEKMLEDRKFRLQIVEGNVKIEHILSRTSTALGQSIRDISEGIRSTKQFTGYLESQKEGRWRKERPDVAAIFDAMKGNTEGWYEAFLKLEEQSNQISGLVVRLNTMISEMDQKAGVVSRRTRFSIQPFSEPDEPQQPRSPTASDQSTPHASPPRSKVPTAPPRISLNFGRMSSFLGRPTSTAYFDLPLREKDEIQEIKEEREPRDTLPAFQYTPAEKEEEAAPQQSPKAASKPQSPTAQTDGNLSPESPPADNEALYILQPRTYTPLPPAPLPSPRVQEGPSFARGGDRFTEIEISLPQDRRETLQSPGQQSQPEADQPQPKQRTSLRQRVSLKTNPPESIQVPPPNALELQRPRYPSPRAYQAPDSAYGSDFDRTAVHSVADNNSYPDFSPPTFPNLIPSPHSDQQYFRPVQASPHSPLQQRPHTAGTIPRQGYHQRNAPSAMGMSMLSSVTTLHPGGEGSVAGGSSRTLKKKRSAFGWLKKAFSLDEEERAAFEQRKREESRNLYYDGRSPKFLDGKRIR